MPARPGLRKASPSRETPWSATIARVVSERASWIARRSRLFEPLRFELIISPTRDAGAGQQQRGSAGGPAGDPEQVRSDVHEATANCLSGRSAATTSTLAVVVDDDAAMGQPLGGTLGPGEQRRLRVDLGEQGGGGEGGRLDDAGEGRLAAARGRGCGGRRRHRRRPSSAGRCRSSPRRRRAASAHARGRRRKGRRPAPCAPGRRSRRCGCRRSSRPRRSGVRAGRRRRGRRPGPWRCRRCRSSPPAAG